MAMCSTLTWGRCGSWYRCGIYLQDIAMLQKNYDGPRDSLSTLLKKLSVVEKL